MRKLVALAASLLITGCATATTETTCVPWSGNCEPSITYKWQTVTHFEEGRSPITERTNKGRTPQKAAEGRCQIIPTPWAPQKVTHIEVTNIDTGQTTSIDCSDADS